MLVLRVPKRPFIKLEVWQAIPIYLSLYLEPFTLDPDITV